MKKFATSRHWIMLFVVLAMGMTGCRDLPTEPLTPGTEEPGSSISLPTPEPSSGGEEGTSEDTSGYCDGSELLCLSSMTSEAVAKYHGNVVGGSLQGGEFAPSSTGGITFPLAVDASRSLKVEFDIAGNIPNWNRTEKNGGKVSLFTIEENGGTYYVSLQRMSEDYRGGGIFRVILGDRADMRNDGAAWLITHRDLAGHYSMEDWGNEEHQFAVKLQGNSARIYIDSYRSRSASAPYGISGGHNVTFVLGNREPSRMFLGEAALTRFQRLRITYE